MNCIYLKEVLHDKKTKDNRNVHKCEIHGFCTKKGESNPFASCETCKDKLYLNSKNLASDFRDPLFISDRNDGQTHFLRGILMGRPTFLVCGGPSTDDLDLEQLNKRGIWSLAVNNMAGKARVNAFVCSDPPSKFHDGIWTDPSVIKFIPIPKMKRRRGRLRKKVGDEFEDLYIDGERISACDCPMVWAFQRRAWMSPNESFFTDYQAAWGNHDAGVRRTGMRKTVCTMLLGLRLLYYLGSRTIYLVGVDFWMDPSKKLKDNYSFDQDRTPEAIKSNNEQFEVVDEWMCLMQENKTFDKFGLQIFNCFENSGLRAFPYVPFDLAIKQCLKDFPDEPFSLSGWYEKK